MIVSFFKTAYENVKEISGWRQVKIAILETLSLDVSNFFFLTCTDITGYFTTLFFVKTFISCCQLPF